MFASLLPDADSALALLGQEVYGRYHRVMSHSIVGMIVVALLAAGIARLVALPPSWRRFGWFVSPNLSQSDTPPALAPFSWVLRIAACAAFGHWVGDWITGFGNMTPLWPWVERDISLGAVNSFDWFLFSITLAWHVAIRSLEWPRRRELALCAAWFVTCACYISARAVWGAPAVW